MGAFEILNQQINSIDLSWTKQATYEKQDQIKVSWRRSALEKSQTKLYKKYWRNTILT